jgi:type III secretion system YscQ/HrcQ family protein
MRDWKPFDFGTLPSFSARQAAAWNALATAFGARAAWQGWITEGLMRLFETPAGFTIRVRQRHTCDPQHAEAVFASDAGKLTIGRDEECDIRLAPRSVGNRHARIFIQAGRCYIVDLGSAIGTFLNDWRLAPNRPAPVTTGDRFTIFPYAFTIEIEERWGPGGPVAVHAGPLTPRRTRVLDNRASLVIQLQPVGAECLLETDRAFLERLSAQVLAPFCPGAADAGLFELLAAAVLERVNRDLPFPLQAAIAPAANGRCEEGGLEFTFAIRIAELTGVFCLSIGDRAIRALASAPPSVQDNCAVAAISWRFPLTAGWADLTRAELGSIEPSDVVLLARESAILFGNAPERGWQLRSRPGNLSQAAIDNYFERGCLSEKRLESATGPAPDFAGLPVRLHAIIGEKEMTLAEAGALVAGTIVELDGTRSEPVRLALNGKVAGAGELVEVDGRLGVRILSWRTAGER